MAYRESLSTLDNAIAHAPSLYLLRMDFSSFFESIRESDIRGYIEQYAGGFSGWDLADVDGFCKLVCRKGALTIGAPSSPGLSNALCYELDTKLASLGAKSAVAYTRYADDLFFSTARPNALHHFQSQVESTIKDLQLPSHLKLNQQKTRHSSRRGARRVTGIVLGSDGRAHVGRDLKRKIRALVFRYEQLDQANRAKLAGLIAYATGVDPSFFNSLVNKYGLSRVRKAMSH